MLWKCFINKGSSALQRYQTAIQGLWLPRPSQGLVFWASVAGYPWEKSGRRFTSAEEFMKTLCALVQDGPDLLLLQRPSPHLQRLSQRHMHAACGVTKHNEFILSVIITEHTLHTSRTLTSVHCTSMKILNSADPQSNRKAKIIKAVN